MASTSPERESFRPGPGRELLWGWGRTNPTAAEVIRAGGPDELVDALVTAPERGVIARGLGRSYGDPAQNAGGRVLLTTDAGQFRLDPAAGTVTASAGASLDDLMRALVPRGWFVPVTPGTRYVTVGGAIASDIHGKNHHRKGTFTANVASLRLALPSGDVVEVGPDRDPDLFWATAGGMGLTGVILDATFRCTPIETSRLLVDTERAANLDEAVQMMIDRDEDYDYTVAWIDLMSRGSAMGRSVLTRGRFATLDELDAPMRRDPLAYRAGVLAAAPPGIPGGLLNKLTVKAFNELWFRKAPTQRFGELQTIPQFFHPLDMVDDWNRIYGPAGFVQWQYVIPFEATDTLRRTVDELSSAGCTSFLAVLKRFGPANPAPLSFPAEGWTLALDIPAGATGLAELLDRLDVQVADAGGRIYLAKDSRLAADLLPVMYPRLPEWLEVRERVDPHRRLRSDLGRRLGLC
ncbi:MAG: FAD-binding oxidoreductase [Acidimicrobiales bacterium]